jgi:outer membrane receptor protein involved in Fe transport
MTQERKRADWLYGIAGAAMMLASSMPAQAQSARGDDADTTQTSEEVVVLGAITYRNRSVGAAPVLEYGMEYFQRFEPLTVGDALKRVPSVAFLSDVLESDGVRLRGLDPAYTQILINGEQVPGSGDSSGAFGNGADGAFFVDRIPAELIERVEIVRSQSANRSGDAVAGAINIVLRDAYSLEGGYVRAGLLYWDNDDEIGGTLGGVWGGGVGPGRLLVGANVQDRHNPKDKSSLRFEEPGGLLTDIEDQTDVRDGTDYSANFSYDVEVGAGEFSIDGFFVHTDRTADEDSIEFANDDEDDTLTPADLRTDDLLASINANNVDTDQDSLSLNTRYQFPMLGGETSIRASYARFSNETFEYEDEASYDVGLSNLEEYESEWEMVDLTDEEIGLKLEHQRDVAFGELEFGLHYQRKERDNLVEAADFGSEIGDADFPTVLPFDGSLVDAGDLEAVDGGDNTIERTRLDPYIMISGEAGALDWETGLRYETTEIEIDDRTAGIVVENDYGIWLPSAHLRWSLTDDDRVFVSVARTSRNPSFTFLSPATLEGELGDNDFIGNPMLDPETAWGLDVGYERRLGRSGVFGVNFFYRDVQDLVEVFSTGAPSAEAEDSFEDDVEDFLDDNPGADENTPGYPEFDPESFVYSARNTGDGKVYGVEFDLSTPLTVIGLENTGVFVNYSWLDSEITDELGERMFNSQAESVFNIGFIHDMPMLGASFGLTYRDQGDAYSRVVGEEVLTSYGADLEFFVEKRLGERFTVRLTGSNLLDESKDEIFDKFDTFGDQLARDYDEYEVETESAGPVFQLIGRYAF